MNHPLGFFVRLVCERYSQTLQSVNHFLHSILLGKDIPLFSRSREQRLALVGSTPNSNRFDSTAIAKGQKIIIMHGYEPYKGKRTN